MSILEQAVASHKMVTAVLLIKSALNITDEYDRAFVHMPRDEDWPRLNSNERGACIAAWLRAELSYA